MGIRAGRRCSKAGRVFVAVMLLLAFDLLGSPCIGAAEGKRILMLHSFGRDFRPWGEYARTIRAELDRLSPWPLDIQDHSLVAARFSDENPEASFVAYLSALNAQHSPDLIIAIGAPAASFVQRNRARLFRTIPTVLTAVEQRRIQFANLTDNDTVVAVAHDFPRSFETILRVLPGTKSIVIINGASPNEKFWLDELRKDAKAFEDRVEFIWMDDISFDGILKKSATLPPGSAIFWHLMNVDATGVAYEGDRALRQLHAVANAPIFSYDDGFFGKEIVGGPMYSVVGVSRLTAAVAVRILGGEKPSNVRTSPVGFSSPKFDWREMQRWGVSESNLPPDSEVLFRESTFWERYRWQVILISCVILVQAAFISGLLHERRRRRLAEVQSRQRLAELAHVNRYSAAGELTTSIAHELNQPLGSILTNTETAELMLKSASPDLDEIREILADIRRDDQRASDVIRRLRSMLRRAPCEIREFDLNETVREVVGFLSGFAHGRDAVLKCAPVSTGLRVKGDPIQLQQVILNLIVNAIDAVSESQGEKREVVVMTKAWGDQAEVLVGDSGPGIAADHFKEIFDPFFTTKAHGMGMGLAIARTIVEAHHGQITAENGSSSGAVFRIRLPLVR
ncbi:sensor histidine kinase [Bradyrhizobium cenepequi]